LSGIADQKKGAPSFHPSWLYARIRDFSELPNVDSIFLIVPRSIIQASAPDSLKETLPES
jgi:hypothetical protein